MDLDITLSDPILIPLYINSGIFTITLLYHLYMAYKFRGTYNDKTFLYLIHIVTLFPIIQYTLQLIDIGIIDLKIDDRILKFFYIEWMVVTPLLLINLSRLVYISLYRQLKLVIIDLLMIYAGYISYISKNNIVIYSSYGIGCISFVYIILTIYKNIIIFRNREDLSEISPFNKIVINKVYNILLYIVFFSWVLYPIGQLLYKLKIINLQSIIIIFCIADVISKCIFTTLLLSAKEITIDSNNISFISIFVKKLIKVYPYNIDKVKVIINDDITINTNIVN